MAVFYLLKAHLNPAAIDTLSGRVLPGWLHLYQNNINSHSTSSGPSTEDKDFPSHPATLTSPSPSLTAPQMVLSWSLTLPPGWWQPCTTQKPLLSSLDYLMIKLMYAGSPPLYLGVTRDNALHTTTTAAHA
ncbi:hypothetical protein EDD17DRAFT_1517132 [Pisolithus thermaeus]|nr:hypothetical protein EDD17DRAFT_1517132 [Pisolithus thermaeus]